MTHFCTIAEHGAFHRWSAGSASERSLQHPCRRYSHRTALEVCGQLHMPRSLVSGFIAGALAVLIFHQGALGVLHLYGLAPRAP